MWLLRLIAAFRTSRVLDDRKMGRASREQALVHALLQQRASTPCEQAPEGLRRAIARRIENTSPKPVPSRMSLAGRMLAFGAPVLLLAVGAAMLLQTRAATTPVELPPAVARPFSPIVAISLQDENAPEGFVVGTSDEGLLTSGPLASMRRPVPGWMRELPGAPVDPTRTTLASDATLPASRVDPLLLEARRFELKSRLAAQSLIRSFASPQQPAQPTQED
jgi:hypothetical protein